MLLEWTGHELVWFPGMLVMVAAAIPHSHPNQVADQKNPLHEQLPWFLAIFWGLAFEVAAVSLLKVICKRPRPPLNHMDMQTAFPGIDQYSFPSGHTSRMAMLAFSLCSLYKPYLSSFPMSWPIVAITIYVAIVGLSRVMLGRHFPGDIVAGVCLGYVMSLVILHGLIPFFAMYQSPISAFLFSLKSLAILVVLEGPVSIISIFQ